VAERDWTWLHRRMISFRAPRFPPSNKIRDSISSCSRVDSFIRSEIIPIYIIQIIYSTYRFIVGCQ
jgi:hypothetical protein